MGATVGVPAAASAASRHLGDRPLRAGSTGSDVRALQRLLSQVGIKVEVDGEFGASTTAAVKRFQRAAHIEASGIVGPRTVRALRRAASGGAAQNTAGGSQFGVAPPSHSSLGDRMPVRRGMSGHDIRVLQDFLRRAGFKTKVDGEFGRGTWSTVRTFERASHLSVDGVVGAEDIAVLRQLAGAALPDPEEPLPPQLAPGDRAQIGPDGLALAPESAPDPVKAIIAAGNVIAKKPYRYGGGHGRWNDKGYDCSGSVSYALHGAGLLEQALPSGSFTRWGDPGAGQWVTLYANGGHIYMVVAGLRFDTSGARQDGTRWHTSRRSIRGYRVRHPAGL